MRIALLLALGLILAAGCAWPKGGGPVGLSGYTLEDDKGPFLGLGVTYMAALRHSKYDYPLLCSNLELLSQNGFGYIRVLSMVGWYSAWEGIEIAPVDFTSREGKPVAAWPDYDAQLARLIDTAYDKYGLRVELTLFADAQLMPERKQRLAHLDRVLSVVKGRESKVILLEVANEAWQNGFPGETGERELRHYSDYLRKRTPVLTALSAPPDSSLEGIRKLYDGSVADIATVHFSRDMHSQEGPWLPVRDCWAAARNAGRPISSNEPIGPGSSVDSESDPVRLVSAALLAWTAGLPMYVYHTSAGVFGKVPFEEMAGLASFAKLRKLLPPDLPNWTRDDGTAQYFPVASNCERNCLGAALRAPSEAGCIYCPGATQDKEFVLIPMGVREAGIELTAHVSVEMRVYNPFTGELVLRGKYEPGERLILPQGSGVYIIWGKLRES